VKHNNPVGPVHLSYVMLIVISILTLCCDNNSSQITVRIVATLIQISLTTEIWRHLIISTKDKTINFKKIKCSKKVAIPHAKA